MLSEQMLVTPKKSLFMYTCSLIKLEFSYSFNFMSVLDFYYLFLVLANSIILLVFVLPISFSLLILYVKEAGLCLDFRQSK